MASYVFLLITFGLCLRVRGQGTGYNTDTCTYSFVVPRPDLDQDCKNFNSQEVQVLKNEITHLKKQVSALENDKIRSMTETLKGNLNINPLAKCECGSSKKWEVNFRDCQQIKDRLKATISDVYTIYPVASTPGEVLVLMDGEHSPDLKRDPVKGYQVTILGSKRQVYCEMGKTYAWTVIMRRVNFDESFNRTWEEYRTGFGNLTGDFWLGLEAVNGITTQVKNTYLLSVDVIDGRGIPHSFYYSDFSIGDQETDYKLEYDSFISHHRSLDILQKAKNRPFITYDHHPEAIQWPDPEDNRLKLTSDYCPILFGKSKGGGWWFDRIDPERQSWRYQDLYRASCGTFQPTATKPYVDGMRYPIKSVELKIRLDD